MEDKEEFSWSNVFRKTWFFAFLCFLVLALAFVNFKDFYEKITTFNEQRLSWRINLEENLAWYKCQDCKFFQLQKTVQEVIVDPSIKKEKKAVCENLQPSIPLGINSAFHDFTGYMTARANQEHLIEAIFEKDELARHWQVFDLDIEGEDYKIYYHQEKVKYEDFRIFEASILFFPEQNGIRISILAKRESTIGFGDMVIQQVYEAFKTPTGIESSIKHYIVRPDAIIETDEDDITRWNLLVPYVENKHLTGLNEEDQKTFSEFYKKVERGAIMTTTKDGEVGN